jgi:hypothetical protein
MELEDFQVGDKVVTMVNNVKVHGDVQSIQLQKKLVDIKIYQPGHTHHCLIVARPPAEITLADDVEEESDGTTLGPSEEELRAFADAIDNRFSTLSDRVATLETLPSALSALQARVDELEGKKKQENTDEPLPGDRSQSA